MARWIDMTPKARIQVLVAEARKIDFAAWEKQIEDDEAKARATRTGIRLELALDQVKRDREALDQHRALAKGIL